MFRERKVFSRQTAPAWLLSLILFLSACADAQATPPPSTTQPEVLTGHVEYQESQSEACMGDPITPIVMHEEATAGAANVEGVMDANNYLVEVCLPTEFDATRTESFSVTDFPRKEMVAMANGEFYTFEYMFNDQTRVLSVSIVQERSILPVDSEVREMGIVAQTHLGDVVVGADSAVVVIDFSASRLAAGRYYQRRFIIE